MLDKDHMLGPLRDIEGGAGRRQKAPEAKDKQAGLGKIQGLLADDSSHPRAIMGIDHSWSLVRLTICTGFWSCRSVLAFFFFGFSTLSPQF